MHERHASKESLDGNLGVVDGMRETFAQLDELLVSLGANVAR